MYRGSKKKVKSNHINKKQAPMEILDFEDETVFEQKTTTKQKKNICKILTIPIVLIILITIFTNETTTNVISQSTRKVLDSLGIYTEEIRNTEIKSSETNDPASWKINKSAKWLTATEAEMTIDVTSIIEKNDRNKDIILLIDNSKSMEENRISNIKTALTNMIYSSLTKKDRISLVTFSDTANILTTFTNDKEILIEKINSITTENARSYTAALKSISTIMDGYTRKENTDVVVVLIANGLPTINTTLEKNEYEIIKNKYPYLTIKGIQYLSFGFLRKFI